MAAALRTPESLIWAAQPGPQSAFVRSPLFEVVYGGARGGGKTDASLGEFALHAKRYGGGAKGLFVRRTRVALEPTIARAREIYGPLGAAWTEQKSRFTWPSGARLYFRYLDRDSDADAYQGHDYSRVYVEELTQFPSPRPVDKLKATLRSATGVPTGFRATCNPSASQDADGSYLLVENHCPICAAATACQGFCRSELQIFQEVLGDDVQVARTEHVLSGARRCAYRIAAR
jgi:hypothetical protein